MPLITTTRNPAKRFYQANGNDIISDIDANFTNLNNGIAATIGLTPNGINDDVQINSAINAVNAYGGGIVVLQPGTFKITGRITPKSKVTVRGAGKNATILQGGVGFDYSFYNSTAINNFSITDLTIDLQNTANASAVRYQYATDCTAERVTFKNGGAGGWFLTLGVTNSLTDPVSNFDNKFIDCDFDTHAGGLEMLLLFNCRNTQIIRPKFRNKIGGGPTFGIYQKCYDTKIIDLDAKDLTGSAIYYCITCEGIIFENPYFENCGTAFSGANTSDNGAFGLTQSQNLRIINPILIGGTNSASSSGIQLGAVNNVVIENPYIEKYVIGINIFNGNSPSNAAATNWTILNPQIKNCNPTNNFHSLHPGVLFSGIGGSLFGKIVLGGLYDDQVTKTQRYPVAFDGAFTWDYLRIANNRLSADTGNGGTSISLTNSATLGANAKVYGNDDYSGSTPSQTNY